MKKDKINTPGNYSSLDGLPKNSNKPSTRINPSQSRLKRAEEKMLQQLKAPILIPSNNNLTYFGIDLERLNLKQLSALKVMVQSREHAFKEIEPIELRMKKLKRDGNT